MEPKTIIQRVCVSVGCLQEHSEDFIKAQGVASLHQIRVHIRRLRNTLEIFRGILPDKKVSVWGRTLKTTASVCGPVRDIDVSLSFIYHYRDTLKSSIARQQMRKMIMNFKMKREKKLPQATMAVSDLLRSRVLRDIKKHLDIKIRAKDGDLIKHILCLGQKRMKRLVAVIEGYHRVVINPQAVEDLHRLRIFVKQLRYTLEGLVFCSDRDWQRQIDFVYKLHRDLGEIHDLDVWEEKTNKILKKERTQKSFIAVLSAFRRYCQSQRKRCYQRFIRSWEKAFQEKYFRNLLRDFRV